MTETKDQQRVPLGHIYGFWRLAGSLPGDSNWHTAWNCEPQMEANRLLGRNTARQHGGWDRESEEVGDEQEAISPRIRAETGTSNHFPYPAMSLPTLILEFGFRIGVRFAPKITETMVQGEKTVEVSREACGSWSGALGSGIVVSGGHDLNRTNLETRTIHKITTAFKLQTSEEEPAM
ncbi:uncharacterized protein ColSpa_02926 [Colletotrichum spaethianum]|uniref:Uncharacterized protein n=1 Tax=Colletotrichum spaethianum TaxID=700344 RepID=A0AA37LB57_9PEZI|nr:uncharacterized protein ColSpa_02926 [Colletotrichum spaethianum]GKT42745.1 hypothetical protein ColSpa_02926 [Colletotrichum spaethianum]